jgi:hypothetical protein
MLITVLGVSLWAPNVLAADLNAIHTNMVTDAKHVSATPSVAPPGPVPIPKSTSAPSSISSITVLNPDDAKISKDQAVAMIRKLFPALAPFNMILATISTLTVCSYVIQGFTLH